jgi:ribosome biogenesis GTPase
LNKYKEKELSNTMKAHTEVFQAVVANITNKQCQVVVEDTMMPCLIPGSLVSNKNSLTVGDQVEVGIAGDSQYKLVRILPRKTALHRGSRRSPGEEILVAANVQYLLAIVTADYLINQAGYLEAAIMAAKRASINVGLFISKWDLIGERAKVLLEEKLALYRAIADTVFVGASHEINEELIQAVSSKTTVVTGDRACGKTSVIQAILKGLMGTEACQVKTQSTHASVLHVGPEGTLLIDTPGFRSFALHHNTEDERSFVFPEIALLSAHCQFRSCTHIYEEGCQVVEALRTNRIKRERYDTYKELAQNASEPMNKEKSSSGVDYRHSACAESFVCKVCGTMVVPDGAGSQHRNHCPRCLSSVHVDNKPGDRTSLCCGVMEPVSVWVRKGGEWAIIHRCRLCGAFSSNRVAADDNPMLLLSIAVKPLSAPPFPLNNIASVY